MPWHDGPRQLKGEIGKQFFGAVKRRGRARSGPSVISLTWQCDLARV